jgi:hypothetical protein
MALALGTGCSPAIQAPVLDDPTVRGTPSQGDYWVEVTCQKDRGEGKHNFGTYSVIRMPDDKVVFVVRELDGSCRVWGAIVPPERSSPDKCDIRLRSKEPLATIDGKCLCVPGTYILQEGRPTSPDCCRRFPNAIYCRDGVPAPPEDEEMEEVLQEDDEVEDGGDARDSPEVLGPPEDEDMDSDEEEEVEDD